MNGHKYLTNELKQTDLHYKIKNDSRFFNIKLLNI